MVSSTEYALETYANLVKVVHTLAGLYIWEYLTTFDFEWQVYTGRRPWKWPYFVYIATRTLTLMCIIISLVIFDNTREVDCEALLRPLLVTAWLGGTSGTFLLTLRGIAIWGRNRGVVILNGFFWLVGLAASFYAITRGRSHWSSELRVCVMTAMVDYKWCLLMRFISDFVLLGTMVLGVFRKRDPTHLWDMLYLQALFWVSAAILSEVPDVIMPFININDPWNVIFQYPHLIVARICHALEVIPTLWVYYHGMKKGHTNCGRNDG
ncbi:hypothetical protein BGW80DRAFT_519615 [Lactifluus volemus]|nr:hypothetical protein BGW80DRAFT_519615 [Lactifluus volemus]